MNIEIKNNTDETILELTGRLDTTTAPILEKTIDECLTQTKNLVLEFKNLEYISSAGLRVLLSTQKKIHRNGSMKVRNVSETIMDIFEMTGFSDILVIE
jgi:anti-sigma B factor antagonist